MILKMDLMKHTTRMDSYKKEELTKTMKTDLYKDSYGLSPRKKDLNQPSNQTKLMKNTSNETDLMKLITTMDSYKKK